MQSAIARGLLLLVIACSSAKAIADEEVKTGSRARALMEDWRKGSDLPEKGRKLELQRVTQFLESADRELTPWLRKAESIEVLSLVPKEDANSKDPARFHGYPVLGRTEVIAKEQSAAVRNIMITGVTPAAWTLCFDPRHGVRIRTKAGVVDAVICFECGQADVYGLPKRKTPFHCGFVRETAVLLNKILDDAKIERDRPPQSPPPKPPDESSTGEKVEFYVQCLADRAYVVNVPGGKPYFEAAAELGMLGSPAAAALIEKLKTSADDYERSMVLYALRWVAEAPEIERALGEVPLEARSTLPPAEEHEKLKRFWLEWWSTNGATIEKLAADRARK
ncbi:MAG TPA: hypothetical protein VGO11_26580 [Chthoniobacteraceae bacterium]|jgi:hypothetical protein|nr:hypothetical protein [Chthoniobacteraceae bacterium]